jgi:hypothetical protein
MITLKEYLEAIDYRITGGSEYQWKCFGPDARYLDCDSEVINEFNIPCIFDSVDQTVYSIEAWDYNNNRCYRWIHPDYIKAYKKACKKHNVRFEEASDSMNYTDLEVPEDILEKARAIVLQEEYDTRIKVPIDFTDEDLLKYMKMAHERDITFNQLIEEALQFAIDEYKAGRLTKESAQRFVEAQDEN